MSSRVRSSGQQPRRSSGSEASERRVLADIEWWKVVDSQCPPTSDSDQDEVQLQSAARVSEGGTVTLSAGGDLESPQMPLSPYSFTHDPTQPIFLEEYDPLVTASLSLSRRRHGRDSSFSSVESTPEVTTPPLQAFDLDFACSYFDVETNLGPLADPALPRISIRHSPPLGFRSFSFGGFSCRENCETHFADLGDDLFSLDQNLFS
ncbi:hypothetical protein ID866_3240 [Astraeus odoratus]|nr:hypothetical protein ID866_3240 [Astraeus odoratus]